MSKPPRKPSGPPSVTAQFPSVGQVMAFLRQLGMPVTLLNQLQTWLENLQPETAEQMEPELMWLGKPSRLTITAKVNDEGAARIEFTGLDSLIQSLQDELDSFFKKKPKK